VGAQAVAGLARADDAGVRCGDALVPRDAIGSGYFVPATQRSSAHVKLEAKGGGSLARIDVPNATVAASLLDALCLGPREQSMKLVGVAPLRSRAGSMLALGLLGGLAIVTVGLLLHATWLTVIGGALALAAPIAFTACDIHVGADGLLVRYRVGSRFVSWDDVESIEPTDVGARVRMRSGALELPISARGKLYYDYERQIRAALIERARAALDAYRQGSEVGPAARLARRGRSRDAWVTALFDVGGDFRQAPLDESQLWRVVENPTAAPTARAAAAAVLARTAPSEKRLRVAADACASPRLRVVLEKAASGAEAAAIEDALAEVDDDPVGSANAVE